MNHLNRLGRLILSRRAPLPASVKVATAAIALLFLQLSVHSSSLLVHANPPVLPGFRYRDYRGRTNLPEKSISPLLQSGLLTQRLAPGRGPSAVYDNQGLLSHLVQAKRSVPADPNVRKRSGQSYMELSCDGAYDRQLFSRLERVCDDCYNLYKEPQVHGMCRSDCFGSETFRQCLQTLLLEEDSQQFTDMIDIIGKKKR